MKFTPYQRGLIALVVLAFVYASMGLFVRYLATSFSIFQQVTLRVLAAFFLSLIFFGKSLDFSKFKKISKKEWGLLIFRSFSWYVLGVTMFSLAIVKTKYSNVSFISALPLTAVTGFILLKEKVTLQKIIFVLLAFAGVLLISVEDYSNLMSWGQGEILALVSCVFFSFAYIARRYHTDLLSNREITVITFFISFCMLAMTSLVVDRGLPTENWSLMMLGAVIVAGFFNVGNIYLTNYGFQHVESVLASNILMLEALFAVILGFIFFKEVPAWKEILGGVLIVAGVIGMNFEENNS